MSIPSWIEVEYAAEGPGEGGRCRCFFPLALARHHPDGPFDLTDGDGPLAGSIALRAGGRRQYQLRWCPSCGGRVGRYRARAWEEHDRFVATAARYEGLGDAGDLPAVRAFCAERGAAEEIGRSDYHVELLDRAASLRVIAGWDPDHERIYGRCLFAPSDELFRDPYRP